MSNVDLWDDEVFDDDREITDVFGNLQPAEGYDHTEADLEVYFAGGDVCDIGDDDDEDPEYWEDLAD